MDNSPCPDRILDDLGSAFLMGSVGGGIWHTFKGYRNAPRGVRERATGVLQAVRTRAPVLGGL